MEGEKIACVDDAARGGADVEEPSTVEAVLVLLRAVRGCMSRR